MELMNIYMGEVLALLTAVVWAIAVILFKKSGEAVHPIGLNLFKNTLAVVLLIPTFWLFGESLFHRAPVEDYLLLLASGALGIGIADTLFFKGLNTLGAGLMAIVICLYSPFIIAMSILFLNETLTLWQFLGAVLIISAVLLVTVEGRSGSNRGNRRNVLKAFLWAVLAEACTATGIVMIKPLLTRSPLVWVTEIRLLGGIFILFIVLFFHSQRRGILQSIRSPQRWGYTISSSITGAYGAMLLWLAGMKYTQASTASALNQTTSIFIFILAALFLREKITLSRVIGIILGVCGAILVTFG